MAVIDASLVIAALAPDERQPRAMAILDQFFLEGGHVPALWALEIANVLWTKQRKGIISPAAVESLWRAILLVPVETHQFDANAIMRRILPLAVERKLTTYDACYLRLAIDLGTPLATVDRKLAEAARAEGVMVL